MRYFFLAIIFFLLSPLPIHAATATIANMQTSASSVEKFGKMEWTFSLSKEYPNPYYYYDASDTKTNNPSTMTWVGAEGVSIDINLTSPSGKKITLPAFYYQDYLRVKANGIEVLGRKDKPSWKGRFTPGEIGTYRYYISVTDKDGTTRYPDASENSFSVTDSSQKGFIRVNPSDTRYLRYDNGQSYIPIGAGQQWWPDNSTKSYGYEDIFTAYGQNNINLLRIWDQANFALSVEDSNTVWIDQPTVYGAAIGVEIGGENVHSGLRAAKPSKANNWYQRIAVSSPTVSHGIKVWIKTSSLSGGVAQVQIKDGNGNVIAQTNPVSGTTGWTLYTATFTPNTQVVSVTLTNTATSGNVYFDDIEVGPKDSAGNITYNIISDPDIERHFAKDNPGNDPNTNFSLPRPLGNFFNPWSSYELDKIVESAQRNGVAIQLCSCSGPWFTWPEKPDEWDYSQSWILKSWQRNFRYRVARWGYSPAILAWEKYNEHGHITAGSDIYSFYQTYGAFQKQTDIYNHLRTTSQNSQAFSPGFWSSPAMDAANYHDYMDFRSGVYNALSSDEVQFIMRLSWCLSDSMKNANSPYCTNMGLGDGSDWIGNPKPWIWGEIGVWQGGTTPMQSGEAGKRLVHNLVWAGLFSPFGTTPLDWYADREDVQTTAEKYASRKAAAAFFANVPYQNIIHILTANAAPPGYSGETIGNTNSQIRAFSLKRQDRRGAYLWAQNKNYIWSNTTFPQAASTQLTINNLENGTYQVQYWNTSTGTVTKQFQQTISANTLAVAIDNLSTSIAVKIQSGSISPTTILPTAISPTSSATPTNKPTIIIGNGDVNSDGIVNVADILQLMRSYNMTTQNADQYRDGPVNSMDFAVVYEKVKAVSTPVPTASFSPTTIPPSPTRTATMQPTQPVVIDNPTEWMQFGGNPQLTHATTQTVATPWKYKWQWNGAGADGKKQANHLPVPDLVQPVTGGGNVYMIANNTVYALDRTTGNVKWSKNSLGTLSATPVYSEGSLYIPSSNGIYKLSASDGSLQGSLSAINIALAPTLYATTLYAVDTAGNAYAINKNTLNKIWTYAGGSKSATPPAFSANKNILVYVTQDLYIHAINASNGTRIWRIKPTSRNYECVDTNCNVTSEQGAQAEEGWPVIAEQHGIVFIKYRLDWDSLWPNTNQQRTFPTTNAEIRTYLTQNEKHQSLFALDMTTGQKAFIPAVGNGGAGDGGTLPMGTKPVIRQKDGKEYAYIIWRNQLTCADTSWCDGREDATMGEMVLDTTTVSGYQAGDVRFVQFGDIQTDEMMNITMAGDNIFHSHWLINAAVNVSDRANTLGNTFKNPIKTVNLPHVIWRQVYCPPTNTNCNPQIFPGGSGTSWGPSNCLFDAVSRYCKDGLYSYGDQRSYPPGFYEYHNDKQGGSMPFTVVSNNLVLVKTYDGGLIALENGSPIAAGKKTAPLLAQKNVLGDKTPDLISYKDAPRYIGKQVIVRGKIDSVVNRRPKAMYLGFTTPHDGNLLLRVFEKDIGKFSYDLTKLAGKEVEVRGFVTLYWPEGIDPEIVITNPQQLKIL